jgi:asparagine synthase (glutamine-hydrolysing)
LQLRGGTTKRVLRDAVADLLPAEVARRPKLGFPVPVGSWLRGSDGADVAERLLVSPVGMHFEPDRVRQVVAHHRAGTDGYGRLVWTLLVLATWSETVLAREQTAGGCAA